MNVAGPLLILAAAALLVLGLADGSDLLLLGSVGVSLLAAVALVTLARQPAGEAAIAASDGGGSDTGVAEETGVSEYGVAEFGAVGEKTAAGGDFAAGAETTVDDTAAQDGEDDDLPDEPSAQCVAPAEATRLALMFREVLVVDGRPRYHLTGCDHLVGRQTVPLPVCEAVEFGFSPCGLCEPATVLLAAAAG